MHSAKSQYIYFENNPFFYRQPVQISQHRCDRVKLASACDQSSGWILDFLKMTDGRCWQTIDKRICIVESRGYESMYQLLGGILRIYNTSKGDGNVSFITTDGFLPLRYDSNHFSAMPPTPSLLLDRDSMMLWSIVSNAALRSSNTSATAFCSSTALTCNSAVSVLCPGI